ncbi:MAG: dihydroorotate dehydrogenase electron transfer subunit [Oscillospiraceae bacterium]|nr:dihydroorotate dehydrogenase electron transfer subunit [Oscillospiraceae bacterium]
MKQNYFTILENKPLTDTVMRLRLQGDTSAITRPGQFVNIRLEGRFLRRPISVCDVEGDVLTLIYKVVGGGTEQLRSMTPGVRLDLLTGLGNGYDLSPAGDHPLVIGGGVGVPPMYWLTKELMAAGHKVRAVLGFNNANEVFYDDMFRALGAEVILATADGSRGIKGFVTDAMAGLDYSYFYACGPEPMLKAVWRTAKGSGQLSFEKRMGCGFGACMGCSCRTITGSKRICKEGPVLTKEEIRWED